MLFSCGHECPWGVAGNGEEMAEAKMEQEVEDGKVRPGREWKNRKGGPLAKAADARVGRKEVGNCKNVMAVARTKAAKKSTSRRSNKDGAEMLKLAADKALVEITDVVVSKLREAAEKGDVVCVKTLMSFSERKKPREKPKKRQRGLTLAQQLAAEPEWEGPPDWGEDEDFGEREPE
jgi:hypothetical protein